MKTKNRIIDHYRHKNPDSAPVASDAPCPCGKVHDPDERFFVTVFDAAYRGEQPTCASGRHGFLLGPFDTHAEALSKVDAARVFAEIFNSRAVWYSFGTCGLPSGHAAQIKAKSFENESGEIAYRES